MTGGPLSFYPPPYLCPMKRTLLLIFTASVILLLVGCKEEVATPIDFSADYEYFPLELNRPVFYAMDSIVIFNTVRGIVYDTTRLEVRETLVESFTAADGRETFRGERWDRVLPNGTFRFAQTYTVSRDQTTAVRSEDNLTFTKLTFPIRENKRWDGNAAFDDTREIPVGGEFLAVYRDWDYRYDQVGEPLTLPGGVQLEETVTVEQAELTDVLIDYRVAYERYAPGIGLVERVIDARASQCRTCCNGPNGPDFVACGNLSWDERAEEGYILKQTYLR